MHGIWLWAHVDLCWWGWLCMWGSSMDARWWLHEEIANGLWKSVVHTHAQVVCAMGHADLLLGINGVSVWMEMDGWLFKSKNGLMIKWCEELSFLLRVFWRAYLSFLCNVVFSLLGGFQLLGQVHAILDLLGLGPDCHHIRWWLIKWCKTIFKRMDNSARG